MNFTSKFFKLFKEKKNITLTVGYLGILTLGLINKNKQRKLNHPVFNELLLKLEEDQEVIEEYGLPLIYDTGIIASRHTSVDISKEWKVVNQKMKNT